MKRLIDYYLLSWKNDPYRKPLLLRGARQVGKTFSVREFGKSFTNLVEINFELEKQAHPIFEEDLHPERILRELSLLVKKTITPGKTLLFLDEIQNTPNALLALRYFYEMLPELHVIAAGSLLDFVIEQVGVPVGRIEALHMHPLSFIEFLAATGEHRLITEIINHPVGSEMSAVAHTRLLKLLGEYLVFGGMPEAVYLWEKTKEPFRCSKSQKTILDFYRQDFNKYAKNAQVKYVELVFEHVPILLGKKFKFSEIDGDYRKRELVPALDLLSTAGVAHRIFACSGQGVPLGSQIDPQDYKVIFLDVGLCQNSLGLDITGWFLQPLTEFVNKGALVEAFVGQEMLAYTHPSTKRSLYYWHREARTSQAEVDYLIQKGDKIIPVEVKSGTGRTLKSLQLFLETHLASSYGIRFSTQNYSEFQNIKSYPLYAIAQVMSDESSETRMAIAHLYQ